jgi:hypothetical protein
MHGSGISIWFFIGVLLLVYGCLICGAGIFAWATGSYLTETVQMNGLHAPVWWGGVMGIMGLLYTVKFRPGRAGK